MSIDKCPYFKPGLCTERFIQRTGIINVFIVINIKMDLFRLIHNRLIFVNCVIGISVFASILSLISCLKETPSYLFLLPAGAQFSWICTILNGIKYKRNTAAILRTYNQEYLDFEDSQAPSVNRFNRMQHWLYIGLICYFIWHALNVIPFK